MFDSIIPSIESSKFLCLASLSLRHIGLLSLNRVEGFDSYLDYSYMDVTEMINRSTNIFLIR